jgi:hypothetical protein
MKPDKNKYLKEPAGRKNAVTTVNLETYQLEIVKRKRLNLSHLTRDLLDEYLKREFPALYEELKNENA